MTAPTIGAWVIERELGRGASGAVYRARHPVHGPGAVKLLTATFGDDPDAVQRFEREAQVLRRVDHPGVVRLLDHGRDARGWYLAMELAPGDSLHDVVVRHGPLDPAHAARLGEQLARALDHVHRQGLVHRDLKPHNVVLTPDGSPRLVDFGLARSLDPAVPTLTATGVLVGTPAFMAPEQIDGQVDGRTDLYALGGVLYFALTGEQPFRGSNPMAVIKAVLASSPDRPSRLRPGIPAALEEVVLRCLSRDPARRPASGAALARDLARAAAAAGRAGPSRAWVAGVAAATALALAAVGALVARRGPAPAPAAATTAPAVTASPAATPSPPAATTPAPPAPAAETAYGLGVRLAARNDFHGALAAYERAVAEDPRDPRAVGRRGGMRFATGDPQGAVADFTRALELDPRDAWAVHHRGLALERLGDRRRALADLDRAVELAPDDPLVRSNRARLRQDLGDGAGALADLEYAATLRPRDPMVLSNLGYLCLHLRRLPEARQALDRALAVDPDYVPALLNRVNVLGSLGELDAALRDATRAVELQPREPRAYLDRGTVLFHLERMDDADADWTRAIELDPRSGEGYACRGTLRARRGDLASAVADLERAVELLTDPAQRAQARAALDEARRLLR